MQPKIDLLFKIKYLKLNEVFFLEKLAQTSEIFYRWFQLGILRDYFIKRNALGNEPVDFGGKCQRLPKAKYFNTILLNKRQRLFKRYKKVFFGKDFSAHKFEHYGKIW